MYVLTDVTGPKFVPSIVIVLPPIVGIEVSPLLIDTLPMVGDSYASSSMLALLA
jgi:hypothetical protein